MRGPGPRQVLVVGGGGRELSHPQALRFYPFSNSVPKLKMTMSRNVSESFEFFIHFRRVGARFHIMSDMIITHDCMKK